MTIKRNLTAIALALGVAAPVAPAAAQNQGACPNSGYGAVDQSGDGILSRDEFTSYGAQAFSTWDADGDGTLSREEFSACAPFGWSAGAKSEGLFAEFDRNGDGSVSEDEFFNQEAYAALDANGNDEVDQQEVNEMF